MQKCYTARSLYAGKSYCHEEDRRGTVTLITAVVVNAARVRTSCNHRCALGSRVRRKCPAGVLGTHGAQHHPVQFRTAGHSAKKMPASLEGNAPLMFDAAVLYVAERARQPRGERRWVIRVEGRVKGLPARARQPLHRLHHARGPAAKHLAQPPLPRRLRAGSAVRTAPAAPRPQAARHAPYDTRHTACPRHLIVQRLVF